MALIFTPGQLARRADFYHQLSSLTGAGLDLLRTLDQLQRHPPERSYGPRIQALRGELDRGLTFTEALRRVGGWLPSFDIAVLQAGEQSGRLDACFRLLSEYYNDRARLARQVLGDLAYPAFL